MEIFDNNNGSADNIEEDADKKDGENLDLPMADSYVYAVALICIHQREREVIDCLESLVLFYLHYFLRIADDASMAITQQRIFYNLNSWDKGFTNCLEFWFKSEISANTTNM